MVLLWHRLKNLLKHLHFQECICNTYIQDSSFLETEQEKLWKLIYLKILISNIKKCDTEHWIPVKLSMKILCFYDYYGNLQALHKQ